MSDKNKDVNKGSEIYAKEKYYFRVYRKKCDNKNKIRYYP